MKSFVSLCCKFCLEKSSSNQLCHHMQTMTYLYPVLLYQEIKFMDCPNHQNWNWQKDNYIVFTYKCVVYKSVVSTVSCLYHQFVMTVYNPVGRTVSRWVRLPVIGSGYLVTGPAGQTLETQVHWKLRYTGNSGTLEMQNFWVWYDFYTNRFLGLTCMPEILVCDGI